MGGDFAVRQWHHMAMWFFVLFAMIHVYLVFYHDYVEGRGVISSMAGGWKFVEQAARERRDAAAGDATGAILVLGVGNVLMGDEGVGVHAVRRLEQAQLARRTSRCSTAARAASTCSRIFGDCDALVMIDATLDGRPPGTVSVIEPRYASRLPAVALAPTTSASRTSSSRRRCWRCCRGSSSSRSPSPTSSPCR